MSDASVGSVRIRQIYLPIRLNEILANSVRLYECNYHVQMLLISVVAHGLSRKHILETRPTKEKSGDSYEKEVLYKKSMLHQQSTIRWENYDEN